MHISAASRLHLGCISVVSHISAVSRSSAVSPVLQKNSAEERRGAESHHAADFSLACGEGSEKLPVQRSRKRQPPDSSLALPTFGIASRAATKRKSPNWSAYELKSGGSSTEG